MALYELRDRPDAGGFVDPVLVLCLDGWIDAGIGATAAIATLLATFETNVIATFDTDTLLDHRARRPTVRIIDGVNSGLSWPKLELRAGRDANGTGVLVLAGPEPDHFWGQFCAETVSLAEDLGVRLAVGLGAFPAPVPHSRPCRLAATASTAALAESIGFIRGSIEVPAGVQAALERSFADAEIPAVGLWARVPHYVAAMPYPEASAALLEGLQSVAHIHTETADLRRGAEETRRQIDELVAGNPDHVQLVRQLEAQADEEISQPGLGQLPTGDEIAAEFERFLRGEGG